MLHTPNYDVRTRAFCGPTAMSAVTGQPISLIRDVLRSFRGTKSNGHARAIMGVGNKELLAAMSMLGWRVIDESGDTDNRDNPMDVYRLGNFLDDHQDRGPYIVCVTGHYYAVGGGEICDTHLMLPLPVGRFRRGRQRWVKRWWKFKATR